MNRSCAILAVLICGVGCAQIPRTGLWDQPGVENVYEVTALTDLPPVFSGLDRVVRPVAENTPDLEKARSILGEARAAWSPFLSKRTSGDQVYEVTFARRVEYVLLRYGAEIARVAFDVETHVDGDAPRKSPTRR
jgi:hypothetical protein